MNLEIEKKVIKKFVKKTKQERYICFISVPKNRIKFTQTLAHFHDLNLMEFEKVTGDVEKIIFDRINKSGGSSNCYLISESSNFDQKVLDLKNALNEVIGRGIGTIIVIGNAENIIYEGEGPNDRFINKLIK